MSHGHTWSADPATLAYPCYREAGLLHRILAKGRPYICPFQPLVEWVQPGSRIFDVGCGCGLWLITLGKLERISAGIGADTNTHALGVASRASEILMRTAPKKVSLTFIETPRVADWPDDTFDVVSLIDVMHHIPPPLQEDFLVAAWQRVRPGGRLIYKDMASAPKLHALANRLHDLLLARQIIHYFPRAKVSARLTSEGGTILHKGEWRRGPYAHELLVIEKCS